MAGPERWTRWRRGAATVAAIASVLAAALVAPGAARAQEGQVFAIVNGLPITTFDIPQRMRLMQIREGRAASRQQAIDELIDDRVKFSEARRFRVAASEEQVNQAFAQVAQRSGFDPRGFDQVLRAQGIEPRVYRGKLRADISWSNMVGARFGRTIFVTDSQLSDAIRQRTTGEQRLVEYTFRQVVLLMPANSPPAVVQRRAGEAQALRGRFTDCATGPDTVRAVPDAAIREPVRRSSGDISPEFRRVLDQTQIGRLTAPSRTAQGFEMVAVCARTDVKPDDTVIRNQARDELTTTEMQRISREYLARIRRTAVIEYKTGGR